MPRRVWKPDEKLSAPKAPPKEAPVRCKRMQAISRIESPICTNGSTVGRKAMWSHGSTAPLCLQQIARLGMATYNAHCIITITIDTYGKTNITQ